MENTNTIFPDKGKHESADGHNPGTPQSPIRLSSEKEKRLLEIRLKSALIKNTLLERENKKLKAESVIHQSAKSNKSEINYNKLFSIISHELRSPVSSMLDLTRLAVENPNDFSQQELINIVKNFETSFDRLYRLIENILYWSSMKLDKHHFKAEEILINEVIESNLELSTKSIEDKALTIHKNLPKADTLFGDHSMVSIVIRNLLNNAIKFTPPGGEITLSSKSENGQTTVTITDTGVGIPKADQHRIFDNSIKFTTSGTLGEAGTGLGLNLCKEMVTQNSGTIRFKSEKDKGSSFYITFPSKDPNYG